MLRKYSFSASHPHFVFLCCLSSSLTRKAWSRLGGSVRERERENGKQKRSKISKKQLVCQARRGAFSGFIEMLYIFHSTCPICVSYIWKGVWHFCLFLFWFLLIIRERVRNCFSVAFIRSDKRRVALLYIHRRNPYQWGIKINCFDTCFLDELIAWLSWQPNEYFFVRSSLSPSVHVKIRFDMALKSIKISSNEGEGRLIGFESLEAQRHIIIKIKRLSIFQPLLPPFRQLKRERKIFDME